MASIRASAEPTPLERGPDLHDRYDAGEIPAQSPSARGAGRSGSSTLTPALCRQWFVSPTPRRLPVSITSTLVTPTCRRWTQWSSAVASVSVVCERSSSSWPHAIDRAATTGARSSSRSTTRPAHRHRSSNSWQTLPGNGHPPAALSPICRLLWPHTDGHGPAALGATMAAASAAMASLMASMPTGHLAGGKCDKAEQTTPCTGATRGRRAATGRSRDVFRTNTVAGRHESVLSVASFDTRASPSRMRRQLRCCPM